MCTGNCNVKEYAESPLSGEKLGNTSYGRHSPKLDKANTDFEVFTIAEWNENNK